MPLRPVPRIRSASAQQPRPRRRRGLRAVAAAALGVAAILLASTAVNLALEQSEKSATVAYGEQVHIDAGAISVARSGTAGPAIVLLTGLGTAAPALDFAPLIRELSGFQTVVVEGFGYGYSDMSARPRTVENIAAELHEVLVKLDIKAPYTLVGHSIAGFSTLYYANKYPGELSAVIGIDPTVPADQTAPGGSPGSPGSTDATELTAADYFWARLPSTVGLVRWATALGYGEPAGDSYTTAERQQMRQMASWNYGNQAVTDETHRLAENAAKLRDIRYPGSLPVLTFLSQDTMNQQPGWYGAHERQLANVGLHELVVLTGDHYLQATQSTAMAAKIREFLDRSGTTNVR